MRTARGEERVIGVDIWSETVSLRSEEGEVRRVALDELRTEVGRRGRRSEDERKEQS